MFPRVFTDHWRDWGLACALALIALTARTYGIFGSSIWVDDVWSIAAATGHSLDVRLEGMSEGETYGDPKGPVPASFFVQYMQPSPGNNLWRVIIDANASENHPPLFYVLLYGWMRVFGFTVSAGRALSVVFAMATIPVLFFLARRLAGETAPETETTAWIACLIFALAPIQSQLAVQVRGYTMFAFLVLATTWMTVEIIEDGPTPGRVRLLTWLGVAGLLTHYFFPLYAFLQGLALLTQRKLWPTAVRIGAVWTVVLAAVGFNFWVQPSRLAQPWLAVPVYWDPGLLLLNAGAALTDLLILDPDASLKIFLGSLGLRLVKAGLVALVAFLFFAATRHLARRHLIFLLLWLAGMFYLMVGIDLVRHSGNSLIPRYLLGLSFAMYILLAAGLAQLNLVVRAVAGTALLLAMLASQYALRALPAGTITDGADFQLAASVIERGWRPNDLVIIQSAYGSMAIGLAYYLPPQTPVLALIHLPRTEKGPVVEPSNLDDLVPRLNQWVSGRPHLWVLRTVPDAQANMLDHWLRDRYQLVDRIRVGWVNVREMTLK
jgi:uncharacterized membrane protein